MSGPIRLAAESPDEQRLEMALEPVLQQAGWTIDHSPDRIWNRWARTRWVLEATIGGPRALTVLTAPGAAELSRTASSWPRSQVLATQSLAADAASDVPWLPRLVPDYCFPPGLGADTFGITAKFHLESRPRLVYLGGYTHGAVLTRLLEIAAGLLAMDGELVLPDSLGLRAAWAPVIRRQQLAERVVFLPSLTGPEMAALLLGADVLLALDPTDTARTLATWGLASGTPTIAQHSPANESLFGPAALWVYEESASVWRDAILQALDHVPLREMLTGRALTVSEPWRRQNARAAWVDRLTRL